MMGGREACQAADDARNQDLMQYLVVQFGLHFLPVLDTWKP
jgi:hypothetical protein